MSRPTKNSRIPSNFVRMCLIVTSCIAFTSCGNFSASSLAKKSVASAKKSVTSVKKSVTGILPSRVPIATVRSEDLQKLPSGADRALAWERHLNRQRYAYAGRWFPPKNYKAPTLPNEAGLPADGGLLPPLHPGQGTTLEADGQLP